MKQALKASMFVIFFVMAIAAGGSGAIDVSPISYFEPFCGTAPPMARLETVVRPPGDGPVTVDVGISSFAFTPPDVTINVGDTVRWTNNGGTHTTTSDTAVWDSGFLSPGQMFNWTFNDAGMFPYLCSIHPFMTANITVMGPQLVINEIDYDTVGTDDREFIELKNVSGVEMNLDTVVVELINGASCCTPYLSIDLPDVNLAADDYYVICGDGATVLNCDLPLTPGTNIIQNGAPDAIGLRISGNLVDAVSYEGDTGAPYTEGSGVGLIDDGTVAFQGISRFPDGTDTNVNNVDLSLRCITPGEVNTSSNSGCVATSPTPTPTATFTATDTPTATATNTFTPTPTPPVTFSGSYNVGTGQTFTSLTMPGGIFEAINNVGVSGNVTINITSDLSGEDGVVALNEFASGFTVLIKPSGAPRTITGSGATGIIRLTGADNVTIDGSTNGSTVTGVVGGNPAIRELTIENTNASTSSSVIILDAGTNGAQSNTIKNLKVHGSGPDQTGYLIAIGAATGGTQGTDNDSNTIENCSLRRAIIGIWSSGTSSQNLNSVINENDITGTGTDRIRRAAITVGNENFIVIKENSIGGIDSGATEDVVGIGVGVLSITNNMLTSVNVTNAEVYRNRIHGVQQTSERSAVGIGMAASGLFYDNMISGVISNATGADLVAGMYAASISQGAFAFNNISMTGDRGPAANQNPSFALALGDSSTGVSVFDNILYTTQTSGGGASALSYAIGIRFTGTYPAGSLNYNDFWSSGANDGGFRRASLAPGAGFDYANLPAWRAAATQDFDSIEADPSFIDPITDPHILPASPARNAGNDVGLAPIDIDGDPRPQEGVFDIGADETVGPTPTNTPTPADTPSISGTITYGNAIGNPVPPRFVKNVSVASTVGVIPVGPVITGTPGTYTLTGFGVGSYVIKPTKPGGSTTAITSNDAARIAQGVSGAQPFVSNNQRFAADTSGNGGVSSQDAAKIAQFVAGVTPLPAPNFTGEWRFFISNLPAFPAGSHPQERTYSSVSGVLTGEDYIGVLIGEVSGNWNPATHPRPVGSRQKAVGGGPERGIEVQIPSVSVSAGKGIVVPVSVQGIADKNAISYEFDLRYDPTVIQPVGDVTDVKGTASRGLSIVANATQPGLLRVVVYGAMPIVEDGVLLNLRFTAVGKPGSVSPLTFERIMFNEGEPSVAVAVGEVRLF